MTLSAMVSKAREILDADDDPKWSDSEIEGYINDCIHEMNSHLLTQHSSVILKTETFTITAGAGPYALDSTGIITDNDYLAPRELKITDQDSFVGLVNFDDREDYSTNAYYIVGNSLYFCEAPTTGASYDFTYHKILTDLDNGTNQTPTWIPSIYHIMFVYYTCWKMAQKDKQDIIDYYYQQYILERDKATQYLISRENIDREYEPSR